MRSSRWMLSIGLIVALLAMSSSAWSKGMYVKVFRDSYGVKSGSTLATAMCAVCHTSKMKGNQLNPYGLDVKKAMGDAQSPQLTKDVLQKIEALDSDQDGVSNLDEITADTLPGDATNTAVKGWQISRQATAVKVNQIAAVLADTKSRTLKSNAVSVADLQLAVAGQDLLLHANIYDRKISATGAAWDGARLEVAAASVDGKTVRKVVLLPKSATGGEVELYQNAEKQPAPSVTWQLSLLKDGGYEAIAVIPLGALAVDANVTSFKGEVAITAAPLADGKPQFTSLFGSAEGYQDCSKFGTITLVAAPGK